MTFEDLADFTDTIEVHGAAVDVHHLLEERERLRTVRIDMRDDGLFVFRQTGFRCLRDQEWNQQSDDDEWHGAVYCNEPPPRANGQGATSVRCLPVCVGQSDWPQP